MSNSMDLLSQDKRRLENPYAHAEELEELRASATPSTLIGQITMTSSERMSRLRLRMIERAAKDCQTALWHQWRSRNGGNRPSNAVDVLDPEEGLLVAGFKVDQVDGLGEFRSGDRTIEVAGLLDPVQMRVAIARHLPLRVRRFTLAHELGHAKLHDLRGVVHRDRPLDGEVNSFDPIELEANRFASLFLMPERLVRKRFEQAFGIAPLAISDDVIFALAGTGRSEFNALSLTKRQFARRLARCDRYNGTSLVSLADQFQVSAEAMAIRIEELRLFKW